VSDKENLSIIVNSILKWWEKHEYDTFSLPDGDEDNVYNYDPDFVVLAKQMTDKEKPYKRPLGDDTPKTPLRESVPIAVPKKN